MSFDLIGRMARGSSILFNPNINARWQELLELDP